MMAARGAFLAPVMVPVASSFVGLPHAFVQSFLGGPDVVCRLFGPVLSVGRGGGVVTVTHLLLSS
jgi:hypothetical protein